jgi:hypothetical protein
VRFLSENDFVGADPDVFCAAGFLVKEFNITRNRQTTRYFFMHETFVEFLSALHVQYMNETERVAFVNSLDVEKDENILRFMFGMLRGEAWYQMAASALEKATSEKRKPCLYLVFLSEVRFMDSFVRAAVYFSPLKQITVNSNIERKGFQVFAQAIIELAWDDDFPGKPQASRKPDSESPWENSRPNGKVNSSRERSLGPTRVIEPPEPELSTYDIFLIVVHIVPQWLRHLFRREIYSQRRPFEQLHILDLYINQCDLDDESVRTLKNLLIHLRFHPTGLYLHTPVD